MRLDASPYSILLIAAVVLFVLAALKIDLGSLSLIPLGLAAFAAAFLFANRGLRIGR